MSIQITSDHDQKDINQLRVDLAQTMIDLTEVFTHDTNSRMKKDKAMEGLRRLSKRMDTLGILHSAAKRCTNVG